MAQLLKTMIKEAKLRGIDTVILHRQQGSENGTLISAIVKLTGAGLDKFINLWVGTIQWTGTSKFRKYHKRKNWFVGVNQLAYNELFAFDDRDIIYEFTRSGGPGGQHVNKVSTAVRARHAPTGEVVFVSKSRSQLQNKKEAKHRLEQMLKVRALTNAKEQAQAEWQNHYKLERGNPVRTFKGSDFKPHHQPKKYKSGRKKMKQDIFRRLDF
ncbi:peptide chain release factor H [Fulvivirgaceae bacterium BMA12]|uniref:Peptide chain release factor H n=1 Tax=Agaribacillus aureus TaxID=3051825 RepID=A0ABT8L5W6_9BACT|nr:peptide chain release factor H [Fulvivirgaceae bacterium BMA12]